MATEAMKLKDTCSLEEKLWQIETSILFFFYFFIIIILFYFIFKLYNIVLVLPNIEMNLPQVYLCSPSWTLLPPPSPYPPSGSSQCTSPFTILYLFCHTSTCIRHGCTRVPHPEPLSHLPPQTSIFKSTDITWLTKVHVVKSMGFPVVM